MFTRFKRSHAGWSYADPYNNGIVWKPNRTIMVAGFGVYGLSAVGYATFTVQYKYSIMGQLTNEIETECLQADMDEKTKICPIMFQDGLVEVKAGSEFIVSVRIYGPARNYAYYTYYGGQGT